MITGKERDAESGLDYFGARYYASSMGRWMSPDWADKPEAVPYSSLDNPQSLNLYGYVLNNPLSHADADGHCCESDFNSFSDHPGTFTGGGPGTDGAFFKQLFAPVSQFMSDHPVLTNIGINAALAIMTRGEGGEVAMPRLLRVLRLCRPHRAWVLRKDRPCRIKASRPANSQLHRRTLRLESNTPTTLPNRAAAPKQRSFSATPGLTAAIQDNLT